MDVKQTPFSTKEEAKRTQRYANTATKGSARYEKSHDDFTEMEKAGLQNPFDDYPETEPLEDMPSFSDRVNNDETEELKADRGGGLGLKTTTPMAVTTGAIQKKENTDEEDLIFPSAQPKESSQAARNKQGKERYAAMNEEEYEESPNSARGSEHEDETPHFNILWLF